MELPTLHWSSSQPVCSDGSGLEDVSRPYSAKEFTGVNLAAAKSGRTHRLNLSALHHNRRANMSKQFETCCCQEKFDETGPEFTFLGHPSDPSGPHPASLVTPKHFPTASASHGSLAWRHRKDWRTGRTWRSCVIHRLVQEEVGSRWWSGTWQVFSSMAVHRAFWQVELGRTVE